jgi:hypothetical protein
MSEIETGEQAEPFFGDKPYQQRARAALPLLVRQAKVQKTIYYASLAEELGMTNPRNLNFVLGSVGQTILQLNQQQGKDIPPIQCLVVNQADGLPGEGVGFFIEKEVYKAMSKRQRRVVVDGQLQRIFTYADWDSVLTAFSMQPASLDFSKAVRKAAIGGRGGGESADHKRLKLHVATHPGIIGLPASVAHGVNEYVLPSGDELDVLFREGDEWIAVEVKSGVSDDGDLVRGLFQCVKYQAVLEAFLLSTGRAPNVRTVLVTTRQLPDELLPLKNVLGIEVLRTEEPPASN